MNETEIHNIVTKQRTYFQSGATLDVDKRIEALSRLKSCIEKYEDQIEEALHKDLGKSAYEGYMCETGLVLTELSYMIKHVSAYAKDKSVHTPLSLFNASSYKKPSPYGVTLIMSPWNYPFLLTMDPLTDALAAGNTAVVKPSAYSPCTSSLIATILEECFDSNYVKVVTGGRAENQSLLGEHFDYIFFTGSQTVGKEVMRSASEYLTPVTLELGGKSPCIVEKSADIKLAAHQIVFGKFLNCGQTCVAPDYVYCDRSIKDKLVKEIIRQVRNQYGKQPLENENYGKIINEKHFQRIQGLIDSDKVVLGGDSNPETQQIEPTVMDNVTFDDPIMKEEIFGPVLPILVFDGMDEVIHNLNLLPHPLALYIFTSDKKLAKKVISRCGFGGGCINDTVVHMTSTEMGFGGFGESGMGAYHGKDGFDTFTHYKSILDRKTWINIPVRYQPYRRIYNQILHMILK